MAAARGAPRDRAGHDARIVEIAFRVVGWAVAVAGVALGCRVAGAPADGALTGVVAVGAGIWAARARRLRAGRADVVVRRLVTR